MPVYLMCSNLDNAWGIILTLNYVKSMMHAFL